MYTIPRCDEDLNLYKIILFLLDYILTIISIILDKKFHKIFEFIDFLMRKVGGQLQDTHVE